MLRRIVSSGLSGILDQFGSLIQTADRPSRTYATRSDHVSRRRAVRHLPGRQRRHRTDDRQLAIADRVAGPNPVRHLGRPGWVLIGLIGVSQLLAALPALLLPTRARLGILAGFMAGGSLLAWIVMQLALLQMYFFLQPVIAIIAAIEAGLAYWWLRRNLQNARREP